MAETFSSRLAHVINELHVPKGQRNSFGNYNYRNAEDIMEGVKPLLYTNGLGMSVSDEIVLIGDRYYVKAIVKVEDLLEDYSKETTAYAREEEDKKGMDGAQVTGAASSYARKYALNGMFCIDDTKDADSMDNRKPEPVKKEKVIEVADSEPISTEALIKITNAVKMKGIPALVNQKQIVNGLATAYGVDNAADLTTQQGRELYVKIRDTDTAALEMLIND